MTEKGENKTCCNERVSLERATNKYEAVINECLGRSESNIREDCADSLGGKRRRGGVDVDGGGWWWKTPLTLRLAEQVVRSTAPLPANIHC